MNRTACALVLMVMIATSGAADYRNPILYADYSDPDVIRVDKTYYMTASSFHFSPGLPQLILPSGAKTPPWARRQAVLMQIP